MLDTFPFLEPSGESRVLGHRHRPRHLALVLVVVGGGDDLGARHLDVLGTGHHLGLVVQEVGGAGRELLVPGGHDALQLARGLPRGWRRSRRFSGAGAGLDNLSRAVIDDLLLRATNHSVTRRLLLLERRQKGN